VAGLAPQVAPAPGALVLIALAATALEQVAWLGIDNLTVPLLVGGLWTLWQ
jgi:dolichol kinase